MYGHSFNDGFILLQTVVFLFNHPQLIKQKIMFILFPLISTTYIITMGVIFFVDVMQIFNCNLCSTAKIN